MSPLPPTIELTPIARDGWFRPLAENLHPYQSANWAAFRAGQLIWKRSLAAPMACAITHLRQLRLRTVRGTEVDCNWMADPYLVIVRRSEP